MDRVDQIFATFMGDPAAGVDIDMKHVLDTWRGLHPKPLEDLSGEDARRQPTPIEAAAILLKRDDKTLDPYAVTLTDMTYPGPDGALKVRIYMPPATGTKPLPVVIFYHGGGFVLENGASTDATSRALAGTGGFIVVAPDYRLAPEHKFPAAQYDSLAAYKWVLANAASFGGDPDRVALAGEGAGALLAADTAMAARDDKLPKAAALVLITPAAGINLKTNSWIEDSTARPWNKAAVEWALKLYLPTPQAKDDPRIDLVGKANVDDLPPTTIVTAEDDPLRSDGERLGGKLKLATVPVSMRDYPGVTHDFFGMGAAVGKGGRSPAFRGGAAEGRVLSRRRTSPRNCATWASCHIPRRRRYAVARSIDAIRQAKPSAVWPERCSAGASASWRLQAELINAICEKACGKLPDEPLRADIVFLRDEAEIGRDSDQPFEHRPRISLAPDQDQIVDEPERAGDERPFGAPQSVVLVGDVAAHEAVLHQKSLDGIDGLRDARIVGREEAGERHQQDRRVHLVGPVALGESADRRRSSPSRRPRRGSSCAIFRHVSTSPCQTEIPRPS